MKTAALILAAGYGKRLGELGAQQAKATLSVRGKPLIVTNLTRFRQAGFTECVVNLHHLGEQIQDLVGDGSELGIAVSYAEEETLLDVAGGIANVFTLVDAPTLVIANADIVTDYPLANLVKVAENLEPGQGHIVLGNNPDFRPHGDFVLDDNKVTINQEQTGHTYIGQAVYTREFFAGVRGVAPMYPVWEAAVKEGSLFGEIYPGEWLDAGTPERLDRA